MKYFSTFSGIGGFELAITQAYERDIFIRNRKAKKRDGEGETPKQGLESATESLSPKRHKPHNIGSGSPRKVSCVGYSEIDKYAIQVYQKNFPNHKNYGDITRIKGRDVPEHDLFVGGFPCQSFSIAGKRRGFQDTRGTLFFEIAWILRIRKPKHFILENVKGLLSHDEGNTFKIIIQTLDELGYFVEWQVLNSKNFGVPQNRERVFIVGHLGGEPRRKVFPIGEDGEEPNKGEQRGMEVQTAQCLNARMHKMGRDDNYIAIKYGQNNKERNGNTSKDMFTLKTGGNNAGVTDGNRIRRLTPLECERLQGFPDNWTEKGIDEKGQEVSISDTQRYKTCGNAITTCVAKEIVLRLLRNY